MKPHPGLPKECPICHQKVLQLSTDNDSLRAVIKILANKIEGINRVLDENGIYG